MRPGKFELNSPSSWSRVQSRRRARRQGRIRLLQPASPVDGRRHRVRSLSHYFSTPDSSALPLRPGVHVTVHVQLRCSLPAAGRQCPWPIQHRHESWPECCGGHPERGLGAAAVPPLFRVGGIGVSEHLIMVSWSWTFLETGGNCCFPSVASDKGGGSVTLEEGRKHV